MERPRGFAGVRIDVGYHAALSRYVARARPNKSLHASRDCLFLKMLYQFIVAATARPRELNRSVAKWMLTTNFALGRKSSLANAARFRVCSLSTCSLTIRSIANSVAKKLILNGSR